MALVNHIFKIQIIPVAYNYIYHRPPMDQLDELASLLTASENNSYALNSENQLLLQHVNRGDT